MSSVAMNRAERLGWPSGEAGGAPRRAARLLWLLGACAVLLAWSVAPARALTLKQCVELALKNNPSLQAGRTGLKLAHSELSEQRSRNFGRLEMVSSYTRYNLPRTLAPMTPAAIMGDPTSVATTENLFTAGLVYEVALFTGFAQTRSIEIAALQKEMGKVDLRLSREQLIYNVKTLYVKILAQKAQEKAQRAYLKALQRLHDDIAYQLKLGKKARVDLLKAAADLEKARATLFKITAATKNLTAGLLALLDVGSLGELEEIDPTRRAMSAVQQDFTGRIPELRRLKVAQMEVDKNKLQVERANSEYFPQVVLSMGYGHNFGPNDSSNYHSGDWRDEEVWQAGLMLKWNLFDFGVRSAKLKKARLRQRQSRYRRRQTELELRRALEEAVTKINTAVAEFKSARSELAMTKETEAIEQVRFDKGAADINDLLYAKARNQMALSRYINAGYNYMISRFYLDYLLERGEEKR